MPLTAHSCDPFGGISGKNIVRLRIKDGTGRKSNPYDFDYVFDDESSARLSSDENLSGLSLSASGGPGLLLDISKNESKQADQQKPKHHFLSPRSIYGRASAVQVKTFRQSGKKKLAISGEWFDQATHKGLLEVISHERSLKAAARSKAPLVYNRCDGHLYRNGNGALPSLGEVSEGGLLAILHNSPDLTSDHFVVG